MCSGGKRGCSTGASCNREDEREREGREIDSCHGYCLHDHAYLHYVHVYVHVYIHSIYMYMYIVHYTCTCLNLIL